MFSIVERLRQRSGAETTRKYTWTVAVQEHVQVHNAVSGLLKAVQINEEL